MANLPHEIRALMAAAARLLPASERGEWSREWRAEFAHALAGGGDRRAMFRRAAGCFPDAWCLLLGYGIRRRIADVAQSRLAHVVIPAFLLMALCTATSGFRNTRSFLFRAAPEKLVMVVQPTPLMGRSGRIPVEQAERWRATGRTVETLGLWTVDQNSRACRATTAAGTLLGLSGMRPDCARTEPLTAPFAGHAAVVARLRPGAALGDAQAEVAATAGFNRNWQKPEVVALVSIRRTPMWLAGLPLLALFLAGASSLRVRSPEAAGWALAPLCLWFADIGGAWLELLARAPVTETAGFPASWNLLVYFFPIVAAGCAAWYLRRRPAAHCRVCYRPLLPAVFVGMEGRCLFEPGGRERLCPEGHGALVTGFAAQHARDEVWMSWEGTWA